MPQKRYITIGLIFVVAAIVNGGLRYIDPPLIDSLETIPLLPSLLSLFYNNKFLTAVIASLIMASQLVLGIFLYPFSYIRERQKRIIKRIFLNLFEGDIEHHRVTLFKEVKYHQAIRKHFCALWFHLIRPRFWFRFLLHLKHFPPTGNYLVIDVREGRFVKSCTMFKVEENLLNNCEGIVGWIRFQKGVGIVVPDLPDITELKLDQIDLSSTRRADTKNVIDYMKKGYMKDIDSLKSIHFKARHFLGSVIYEKGGVPWGMILVDSINSTNPFTQEVVDKFKIYSEIITDLVS